MGRPRPPHEAAHYFDANAFWPLRNSLAFSDPLIGYAPAAVVRYNLLFLFASALAFAGAYLLARQLGCGRAAAVIAGLAFVYSPWRLSQVNHLHVLSSGGIPLSLFFLLRGHRERIPLLVLAGWVTAARQVSLGFVLGLQLRYLLGAFALLETVAWFLGGKPQLDRSPLAATAAGILVFAGWAAFQARPYLEVVDAHPEARRQEAEVEFFSPPKKGLLAAPDRSLVWGRATRGVRDRLHWPSEQTVFPGLAVVGLAAVGVAVRSYSVRARAACACGAATAGALSLGFHMPGGRVLYGTLYRYAPGWQGLRTPGRLMTLTSLFLGPARRCRRPPPLHSPSESSPWSGALGAGGSARGPASGCPRRGARPPSCVRRAALPTGAAARSRTAAPSPHRSRVVVPALVDGGVPRGRQWLQRLLATVVRGHAPRRRRVPGRGLGRVGPVTRRAHRRAPR